MKIGLVFLMIYLSLGCSSKNEKTFMKVYTANKEGSKKLQKTEKIQLYDSQQGTTKVLLISTYISKKQTSKKINNDEKFIIGLYIDDNETEDVSLESFSLRLNGKAPKSIKTLKVNHKLLNNIPFVFPWTQFYLVEFSHTPQQSMKFTVHHGFYGKGEADFAKVAKFVLRKRAY